MNNMTKRADYEEINHFGRLPEDVFVSIFDRVADLKGLCHCSLVSKHFAAVVSRVQIVSVAVTGSATYDLEHSKRIRDFMFQMKNRTCKTRELTRAFVDSLSLQNMKFPAFFYKLTELKCVYLDYDYSGKSATAMLPMRKIKFCHNGTKFERFLALEYSYMHRDTENEATEEEDIEHVSIEHVSAVVKRVKESWRRFRLRFMEWACYAAVIISCHASLPKVTIVDSEVNGKLVVGDINGIADIWKTLYGCYIARFAMVPMLRLPLSGYVMRCVALAIVYHSENSGDRAKKLNEVEFWDLDDELPVFREAVKELLKNHEDKLTSSFFDAVTIPSY